MSIQLLENTLKIILKWHITFPASKSLYIYFIHDIHTSSYSFWKVNIDLFGPLFEAINECVTVRPNDKHTCICTLVGQVKGDARAMGRQAGGDQYIRHNVSLIRNLEYLAEKRPFTISEKYIVGLIETDRYVTSNFSRHYQSFR